MDSGALLVVVILGCWGAAVLLGVIAAVLQINGWSFSVLRAKRRRHTIVMDRAVSLMDCGYTFDKAQEIASAEMEREADANRREIEALTR